MSDDRCEECQASKVRCPHCERLFCDMHLLKHFCALADNQPEVFAELIEEIDHADRCPDCDASDTQCYVTDEGGSEDAAWAREQDEREAIAATRPRQVTRDETDDEVLPW